MRVIDIKKLLEKIVIDHNHIDSIREDARKLAGFLDKPVWDATGTA